MIGYDDLHPKTWPAVRQIIEDAQRKFPKGLEAEMTKLWCIALSFGDTKTGSLVLTHYLAPTADLAAAQCVSQFYTENPGVRLPLAGMAVLELSRERLEAALRAMDEEEQKPPAVVPLRRVGADYLERHYGMEPSPLSEGPGPADEDEPA